MNEDSDPWDPWEGSRQGRRKRYNKASLMPNSPFQKVWNWAPPRWQRPLSSLEGVVGSTHYTEHWVPSERLENMSRPHQNLALKRTKCPCHCLWDDAAVLKVRGHFSWGQSIERPEAVSWISMKYLETFDLVSLHVLQLLWGSGQWGRWGWSESLDL